ncbi:uncharacterized protein MCYG_08752 [Microsporum canis CBS 113480]|uniref:Uncharacterized protein n=1 Tax=Arthroderma otae (strain ATCC MYA-4605 / CBS 113480) TaxID=554155 RepID=C5G1D0_ARTOC|nr:uncharacterized protein MCYG_08752 [Microsporum canis CBS 113480]EEQ28593.1 hypothetical protein MCYG_08752 [Microsporum canis CBS 113480]
MLYDQPYKYLTAMQAGVPVLQAAGQGSKTNTKQQACEDEFFSQHICLERRYSQLSLSKASITPIPTSIGGPKLQDGRRTVRLRQAQAEVFIILLPPLGSGEEGGGKKKEEPGGTVAQRQSLRRNSTVQASRVKREVPRYPELCHHSDQGYLEALHCENGQRIYQITVHSCIE